jgi:hypothetical protein
VELRVKGETLPCTVTQVVDTDLRRRILTLRNSPPLMDRVVFEIRRRD